MLNTMLLQDRSHPQRDRIQVIGAGLKFLAVWSARLLIIAVFGAALTWLLLKFSAALLPVGIAMLVSTVLYRPTQFLIQHKVPPALAAIIWILVLLSGLVAVFSLIIPSLGTNFKVIYHRLIAGIEIVQDWLIGPPLNLRNSQINQAVSNLQQWLQDKSTVIASELVQGISTAGSVLINLGIVVVLTFFFLKDGDRLLPWLRGITGPRVGWHLSEVAARCWQTLGGFIRAQATVSLIDGLCIGLGLSIIGVPLAFVLALITFIAGFVPIVGAFVSGIIAVLIALVTGGISKAIMVIILVLAVQQLEGNVLSPMLQAKAVNLHPVIVLIAVTIGSTNYGIAGAFFAVPLAALLATILRYLNDIIAVKAGEKQPHQLVMLTPMPPHLLRKMPQEEA